MGVEFLRNGRPEITRAGDGIVVAAGAINTPHLLMLSGIGPAEVLALHGIETHADVAEVGQNLQDHINIPVSLYTHEETGVGAWDAAFLKESFHEWQEQGTGPRSVNWAAARAHVSTRAGEEPDLQVYGAVSAHRDCGRFLARTGPA